MIVSPRGATAPVARNAALPSAERAGFGRVSTASFELRTTIPNLPQNEASASEPARYSSPDPAVARFQLWTRSMDVAEHDATAPDPDRSAPFSTDLVVAVRNEHGTSSVVWLASGSREEMERALAVLQSDGWDPADTCWNAGLGEWTRSALPVVEITPDA